VALMRDPDNAVDHTRELIIHWLLIHGASPKHVKNQKHREEATEALYKLWNSGSFATETEKTAASSKDNDKNSPHDEQSVITPEEYRRERRNSTMLIPSRRVSIAITPEEEKMREAIPRRSVVEVMADLGIDQDDRDYIEMDEEDIITKNSSIEDDEKETSSNVVEEETSSSSSSQDLKPLISIGHIMPPGITIQESPPGISNEDEISGFQSLISRVADDDTRKDLISALFKISEKLNRVTKDRDQIREQFLSLSKNRREQMLSSLDQSDLLIEDDEEESPIWKKL